MARKTHGERGTLSWKCERCGKERVGYAKQKYCSQKCYHAAVNEAASSASKPGEDPTVPKTCTKCGFTGETRLFPLNSRKRGGRESMCKPCKHAAIKAWQEKNPEKVAEYSRKYSAGKAKQKRFIRYGITERDFHLMLEKQDNCCAICCRREPEVELVIDHDHETEVVRGILCLSCNTALGKFHDNKGTLFAAIMYLRAADSMNRAAELGHDPVRIWTDDEFYEAEMKKREGAVA